MYFNDRKDAGRRLAKELVRFKDQHPVVLALPRGGVPVGYEVASELNAPLDVVLVRKIGHPALSELAIGAIAQGEGLETVIDDRMVAEFGIGKAYIDREIARQKHEIDHRRELYFANRKPVEVRHATAIVVDDGIATGATMRAALREVRKRGPQKLVLAVPVAAEESLESLRCEADETVCLLTPLDFGAVGLFYADFAPVEDEVVLDILKRAAARSQTTPARTEPAKSHGAR